jgi:hypothetical protein
MPKRAKRPIQKDWSFCGSIEPNLYFQLGLKGKKVLELQRLSVF